MTPDHLLTCNICGNGLCYGASPKEVYFVSAGNLPNFTKMKDVLNIYQFIRNSCSLLTNINSRIKVAQKAFGIYRTENIDNPQNQISKLAKGMTISEKNSQSLDQKNNNVFTKGQQKIQKTRQNLKPRQVTGINSMVEQDRARQKWA